MIKDEDIYKKILSYYDLSEKIMKEVSDNTFISAKTKEDILIPIADKIKNTTDFLVETYVMFLKTGKNNKFRSLIISSLDKLLFEISVCKNKLSLSKERK